MVILIIGVLLVVIVVLIVYNFHIQKKIDTYNNINQQISNLSVLQEFMKVAGEEDSVDAKLNKINEIVIEKYDIKYSTIVVFDGAEYVIKATNVDELHHETLTNLHNEEIFQDSVATATPLHDLKCGKALDCVSFLSTLPLGDSILSWAPNVNPIL